MTAGTAPLHIIGQGLAGSCLAWQLHWRGIPFQITDNRSGSSTRVAAGLINPITGKNFEASWRIQDFHSQAIRFYQKIEATLGRKLWHPTPILRLASTEAEWKKISAKLTAPQNTPWLATRHTAKTPPHFTGSVELQGGGWLDTAAFLDATAHYFSEHFTDSPSPTHTRILCQGATGLLQNQLGTHRCAKGEILTLTADWPETHIRIGAGGWLVPIGNHQFRVGSTYEWNQLDYQPTAKGRTRIEEIATKLGGPFTEITHHLAAIRPILRRSQPLIGKNPTGDWIFNALGSKGTLYAPKMAQILSNWILDHTPPEEIFILPTHPSETA